jgi:hypothetical protein
MTPRTLVIAALLVFASLPASAEFCGYADRKDMEKFRDLSGPECRRDSNTFVFRHSSPSYSRTLSKDGSTYVTDSFPGFMGDEQKCMNSEKGARILGEKSKESYLLAFAPSGLRVFRWKGSCWSLKDKFLPALARFQSTDAKTQDSAENAFKAIGAKEISVRALTSRLIEVGEGGYKALED